VSIHIIEEQKASMKKTKLLRRHVSIAQGARALGVAPVSVARWLRIGVGGRKLASFKLGGRRRIFVDDLRAFACQRDPKALSLVASDRSSSNAVDTKLDRMLSPRSARKSAGVKK
jgi:hypothetical protein